MLKYEDFWIWPSKIDEDTNIKLYEDDDNDDDDVGGVENT